MAGSDLTRPDAELVRVFTTEQLLARRRVEQDGLRGTAKSGAQPQN